MYPSVYCVEGISVRKKIYIMNMNNELHIPTTVLSKILDRFITTMQIKHCNKSSRITPM
jgi:prenyltransferase beta subunit